MEWYGNEINCHTYFLNMKPQLQGMARFKSDLCFLECDHICKSSALSVNLFELAVIQIWDINNMKHDWLEKGFIDPSLIEISMHCKWQVYKIAVCYAREVCIVCLSSFWNDGNEASGQLLLLQHSTAKGKSLLMESNNGNSQKLKQLRSRGLSPWWPLLES